MFDSLRQWLDDVTQDKRAVFLMGLVAFGAVAIILASGSFGVQFGQLFAADTMECRTSECRAECGGDGYCDGDSCVCSDSSEDTPSATSTEPCVPVSATNWGGFPPSVTAGNNACREVASPPIGFPPVPTNWMIHAGLVPEGTPYECFRFTIPEAGENNEWALIDASQGGAVPPSKKAHTLRGQVFNNCPWEVELSGGAAGSNVAGSDHIFREDGTVDESVGLDEIISRVAPAIGTRIPSCWNRTGSNLASYTPPAECQVPYVITVDTSGFNSGRIEAALLWQHFDGKGPSPGGVTRQDGYGIVINYGSDFTGAPGQNGAGQGSDGGGTSGTGVHSDAGWCGEWTDAIWAQRHAAAAHNCNPGYVITQELADYFFDTYGRRPPAGSIGKNDGFFLDWSNGEVQAFIDVMDTNYAGGNQGCVPNSGVDYDAIEAAYEDISKYGFGLSDNGTSLIAKQCKDPSVEPATLEASCPSGEPPVQLTWNIPVGAVANSILKRNITAGTDSQFMTGISSDTTFLEDSDVEDGTTYSYAHKAHASVISESVEVTIDDDGTCGIQVIEPVCGDGTCQDSETCNSCEQDCGTCGAGADCGDGVCQLSETCSTCEEDCNACPTESPGVVTVITTPTPGTGGTSGTGGTGTGTGGQVGTAGTVPTGPGEATVVALLLSALTALLYVSYTHTNVFKEREAKHLGEEQDPMDFRQ